MVHPPRSPAPTRRKVLGWAAAAGAAAPVLSACGGMSTSESGEGGLTFISTQFTPVEEAKNLRGILRKVHPDGINLVISDSSQLGAQVRSQAASGNMRISLIGGLHGDFAQLGSEHLEDLSDLMKDLSGKNHAKELVDLAKLGSKQSLYVPWCQATYVLTAKKTALEHLPSGAKIDSLTYDQYLDWAIAARRANGGKPLFGLPAGPEGLLHRFIQGHLYPSFTGGLITTFRSREAVTMWQYLKDLWANTAPASTNYDFMQQPLATGEVAVAWDHVARLVEAPKDSPRDWVMAPSPAGPKGLGYMAVVVGLGIPKGAKDVDKAKDVIRGLSDPDFQIELLRKNSFFPTVEAKIPKDLPPAIRLESDAVHAQQQVSGSVMSLPPVGLDKRDAEMSKVFRDAFTAIVLDGADIRRTLDSQAKNVQAILDETKVSCWAPDPVEADQTCTVG